MERIRWGKSSNGYLNSEKCVGARRNRHVPTDLLKAFMVKQRHLVPADTDLH